MTVTAHEFFIGGAPADLAALGIEPTTLSHTFGRGATLSLRQTRDHHRAALPPNTEIRYAADGVVRFVGRVQQISRRGVADTIEYRARDAIAAADSLSVNIDPEDLTVAGILERAFNRAGWVAHPSIADLTSPGRLDTTQRGTLTSLLGSAMAAMPEYRLIVMPAETVAAGAPVVGAHLAIDTGSTQSLTWGGPVANPGEIVGRPEDFTLDESIDGAFSAVEVFQPRVGRGDGGTTEEVVQIANGWASSDEADWTLAASTEDSSTGAGLGTDPASGQSMVFRAFEFNSVPNDFDPTGVWRLMVEQPANRRRALADPVWVQVEAEYVERFTDDGSLGGAMTRAYIVARHPVTVSGDVRMRGAARGPANAVLVYERERGGGVTSLDADARWPPTGHAGEAHELYGIETTRRIQVTRNSSATEANAREIHAAVSRVRHSGSVPIFGRLPVWGWQPGQDINVAGQNALGVDVLADYRGRALTHTGYRIDFPADRYELDITDDRSQFVRLDLL